MKIICIQENLETCLNIAQNIVGRNLTLPILNNLLLETDAGRLKVSATNLEIGINAWTAGKIEKPGAITCPAKILSNLVNSLPNKKIELETKGNSLFIQCENYRTMIKGLSAEDFPLIPKIKGLPLAVFKKTEALKNGLAQVVFSAASSEARPEFSGVLFKIEKNLVHFVATDSFRLAEKTIDRDSGTKQSNALIVPQRTVQELIRILNEKPSGEVRLILGDSQILFELDDVQLISRLIDAQYPDYQQIIPKSFQTQIVVSRAELTDIIKVASLFSGKINDVKLSVKKDKIEILSQDSELGENKSQMFGQIKGEPLEIIFNFRYLIEGLANISTKQVFFGLNQEAGNNRSNPAVIKPVGEEGYLYVVMPIKTN